VSTIIKTQVAKNAEQFTLDGVHYVGRRVLSVDREGAFQIWNHDPLDNDCLLFRLDYDRGDIFVDPALLRPFPDSKIEEPSK
jgi:hypothetical protein